MLLWHMTSPSPSKTLLILKGVDGLVVNSIGTVPKVAGSIPVTIKTHPHKFLFTLN